MDFGAGPVLTHPDGKPRRTWAFVMTLAHSRRHRPGQRMTLNDHLPPAARAFFARDKRWCVKRAAEVGPRCAEFVERVLSDRVAERLRSVQGVLAMSRQYDARRLEVACERALGSARPR